MNAAPVDELLAPAVAAYRKHHPDADLTRILDAGTTAAGAHAEQRRHSGELYITHPAAVAAIVAELGMDEDSIIAALLHDVVEDTPLTVEDVEAAFGPVVSSLVDGLSKIHSVHFTSAEASQAATMRKMLLGVARDLRVLVVKLADRLHNMRTIAPLPPAKRERIAKETLYVFAPLANRLGLQELKGELEDLAFEVLHPDRHAELAALVAGRRDLLTPQLDTLLHDLVEALADHGIAASVTGRAKRLWSVYEKMTVRGRHFDEIHDLVGVRILVDTVGDCYTALGALHARYTPIPGRLKDHIATPKFNLYQSLHSTVIGPGGQHFEVQIRTKDMHARADRGIAAHWSYKARSNAESSAPPWVSRLTDWTADPGAPEVFLDAIRAELGADEIFVFTPKGLPVPLPQGSTAVDFAYAIHTEIGDRCIGARIDGRLSPLAAKLHSGDRVEIVVGDPGTSPRTEWLGFVVTPKARGRIRQWFQRERRDAAAELGRDSVARALRGAGLPTELLDSPICADVAANLAGAKLEDLWVAVGDGQVHAPTVVSHLRRHIERAATDGVAVLSAPPTPAPRPAGAQIAVLDGTSQVMIRLARCCGPVPGDPISGVKTTRGVAVHRDGCDKATGASVVEVEWVGGFQEVYVGIDVEAMDRPKLLTDVAAVLSRFGANIVACATRTGDDMIARQRFEFRVAESAQLNPIVAAVAAVDHVYAVRRAPDVTP